MLNGLNGKSSQRLEEIQNETATIHTYAGVATLPGVAHKSVGWRKRNMYAKFSPEILEGLLL